ncbi:MAG: chalcone isomerase family protein [Deltaproteobacteria bacterium]|nr:chalcone isomerase family protein [Deltaproteobacteria bacterium]
MPLRAAVTLAVAAALALPLAAARPAGAQSLTEPGSGAAFSIRRELLGRRHTVTGVGLKRVYLVFKVYAAAFYVDDHDGRGSFRKLLAATPGGLATLRDRPRLYEWLTKGDWGRALDFVMLRDVERGLMAHAIRARLQTELGDLDAPDVKSIAARFFAAIDVPLRKGQRFTVVQSPGHEIVALLDGKVLVRVRNRRVAAGIWRTNFGPRAPDQDLKRALQKHLEHLVQ